MKYIILLALFQITSGIFGQSPYQINLKKDLLILGGSSILVASDFYLANKMEALNENDIINLNQEDIWSFESHIVNNYSSQAATLSDIGVITSGISAAFTVVAVQQKSPLMEKIFSNDFLILAVLMAETNVLNYSATEFVKMTSKKTRPYVYNDAVELEEKLDNSARKSFFSGHTSISATNCFFAAKVFSDHFPNSKWNKLIWGSASLLPAWTAYQRVKAGKHFISDVAVAYAFGALCGYLIPEIHKKKSDNKQSSIHLHPSFGQNFSGITCLVTL